MREADSVISTGSAGFLFNSLALQELGLKTIWLQGWQLPINTENIRLHSQKFVS